MKIHGAKKGNLRIIHKMLLAYFILFIIFVMSHIIMLYELDENAGRITDAHLSHLIFLEWGFLLLGALFTLGIIFWWALRGQKANKEYRELLATLNAIYRSQAVIEFNMDGTIIDANDKFLNVIGYSLDDLKNKHHSMLVTPEDKVSQEYRWFWEKLRRGEYDQAEYKRLKKNGEEIWLQSSYNPVIDEDGRPVKVIKVATDITDSKKQAAKLAELTANLRAVGRQIIIDSNDLSFGIKELETTAVDQAASASEQASAITEISATIEEIKVSTQQTSEKAKHLGESAERTRIEAVNGKSSIEKMNESMLVLQEKIAEISNTILGLNEKTQQIGEITETVADTAKQLKLLALNASIEAAKAGESGKGFAVVAGEVKDLAEKSKLSTERVQKILQDIRQSAEKSAIVTQLGTKSVDENMNQVKLTGDVITALGEIIESSSLASLQIVSAVQEESVAIEQIDQSMREINKVTNLFASATEQTKQSIINLSKVADSLKNTSNAYESDV